MNQINLESKDAENVGREFMKKLPPNYSWSECPTEYVVSLEDKIFELEQELHNCAPNARVDRPALEEPEK